MRSSELNKLFSNISTLSGIGPALSKKYLKIIQNETDILEPRIIDILWHFPYKIVDRRLSSCIKDATSNEIFTFKVQVKQHLFPRRKGLPHRVIVFDDSSELDLVFFVSNSYIKQLLPLDAIRYISGKVDFYTSKAQMTHPDFILTEDQYSRIKPFQPVYRLTKGITNNNVVRLLNNIFNHVDDLHEWHDQKLLDEMGWKGIIDSFKDIHIPKSLDSLNSNSKAIERLSFDEILVRQLSLSYLRSVRVKAKGISLISTKDINKDIIKKINFNLTDSQCSAIEQISNDMEKPHQMFRLLQGDVGSGKTLVAIICMIKAVNAGYQAALMAPTELLARQHFETIVKLTEDIDINVSYISGKENQENRLKVEEELYSGKIDIVIGTHILFQNNIIFKKLGFIVIDEQHRFGVNQRLALQSKSQTGNCDLLLMTATPIPRTLIQTQYGDIDTTKLEKIPGRKDIKTTIIPDSKIDNLIIRLSEIINLKNKIYWVCPQIEDTENNITSVITRYNYLNNIFKNNVSLAHGKMPIANRLKEIERFYNSETQILVATTVIEVGIDVPDANIIIIENANKFGLTQLHQLRGRVGRNSDESYCMLMYNENINEIAASRLNIIRNSNDGFDISEQDLNLRGSGDIIGIKQSGFIGFKVADTENIIKYQKYSKILSDQIIKDMDSNDLNKFRYKILFELYGKTDFKFIIA